MQKYRAFTRIELCVVVVIVGLLIIFLHPIKSGTEEARCLECRQRLKKLGQALRQYHDDYDTFPPAHTMAPDAKSLHSWRTLILPYLEQYDCSVYQSIKFEETWSSEHNLELWNRWNYVFDWPGSLSSNGTIYKMITGEKTAAGTSMSTWKRQPSKVVLLIEAWPPVPWMSPNDFSLEDFNTAIYPTDLEERDPEKKKYSVDDRNPDKKPIIGAYHPKEFHVLFADGTVKTYKNWKLPISDLEKMCRTE